LFPTEGRDPQQIVPIIEQNFIQGDDPVVDNIEPGFQLQVEFEGYDPPIGAGGPPGIFAYGYDVTSEDPAFLFTVDEGEELSLDNAEDGIILSSSLALGMDTEVGDTVTMKVPGNTADLTVVGISDYPIDQVWLDWRTLAVISGYVTGAPRPNEYQTQLAVAEYDGTLENGQVMALGMDTQLSSFLEFSEGEFFVPGEPGVIISQPMADNGGYAVGETLSLTSANGTTQDYPIVGIFTLPEMVQQQMGAMPADVLGIDYQELVTLEGLNLEGGTPIPQGYFLTTTLDDPGIKDLDRVSDDINEIMLNQGIPVQMFNFVELTELISQALFTIQAILSAVAGLIALIGALGLLTTLSMSVFERQKEIGVMRSIGASSSIVSIQFLTEGLVVGFISWLVGLPLAVFFEYGLLQATQLSDTFPMTYPLAAALIGLIGMMVITTIASLWPSITASRKTVSDILRYQ
ncbi:MAG: FtsX-like permease family protein, partial [Anaerolineae bacterium]|nr:FtsX-like permease family protein [Anaerolineae bacterium]